MKNPIFILTALTCIIAISSCNKANKIQGTWVLTNMVKSNCDDSSDNEVLDYIATDCDNFNNDRCVEFSYLFNEDRTYSTTTRSVFSLFGIDITETETGIYIYDGKTLEICDNDGNNCISGLMSITKDIGSFEYYDNDFECDVSQTYVKQ